MSKCYYCGKYFYYKENKVNVSAPNENWFVIACNKCFKQSSPSLEKKKENET